MAGKPLTAMLPVLHKVEFAVALSNDNGTGRTDLPQVNLPKVVRDALCAALPAGVLVGSVTCRIGHLDVYASGKDNDD